MAQAEFCYYSGNDEQCCTLAAAYLNSDDPALRLSAAWLIGYASLSLGRIDRSRAVLASIWEYMGQIDSSCAGGSTELFRASVALVSAGSAVLLHLPTSACEDLKASLRYLPESLRMLGIYVLAHSEYLAGDYEHSLGLAESALLFCEQTHPIPEIYLRLIMVMNLMSLRRPDEAEVQLRDAWETARHDGFVRPFAEHHGLLQGMVERVLRDEDPAAFKRIIDITYRFSEGWRQIHNSNAGDTVASNLTTTQFATAMLASRGWTNKEIAAYEGVSVNTVKTRLAEVFARLGVNRREDLKDHMLR